MLAATLAKARALPGMGVRIAQTARYYRTPMARALASFADAYFRGRFSPTEIFLLGLLDGSLDVSQRSCLVSKQQMLEAQLAVNPRRLFARTEDKLTFARFCAEHALPTPRIVALFEASPPATSAHLRQLASAAEMLDFLQRQSNVSLVLKPTHGVHGRGILRLHCNEGRVHDDRGDAWSTADVEAHIARSGYRSWLLQELVLPHPALSAISGTRHLQTIRVVTVLDQAGHAEVGAAWLRLIGGDASFDNFNFGQSGNLLAPVDVATGRILRTLAADRGGFGLVEIASHPRTALPFASLSLPWWKEAHALALDAARAFSPLVTIGWDIALAEAGPLLIEGNVTWDPLPGHPNLATIHRQLLALAPDEPTRSRAGDAS